MLQTIRDSIDCLTNQDFGNFYQDYVVHIQDLIINHDLAEACKECTSIEDSIYLIKGINKITEELNKI